MISTTREIRSEEVESPSIATYSNNENIHEAEAPHINASSLLNKINGF